MVSVLMRPIRSDKRPARGRPGRVVKDCQNRHGRAGHNSSHSYHICCHSGSLGNNHHSTEGSAGERDGASHRKQAFSAFLSSLLFSAPPCFIAAGGFQPSGLKSAGHCSIREEHPLVDRGESAMPTILKAVGALDFGDNQCHHRRQDHGAQSVNGRRDSSDEAAFVREEFHAAADSQLFHRSFQVPVRRSDRRSLPACRLLVARPEAIIPTPTMRPPASITFFGPESIVKPASCDQGDLVQPNWLRYKRLPGPQLSGKRRYVRLKTLPWRQRKRSIHKWTPGTD